jgi:hypothetical protein
MKILVVVKAGFDAVAVVRKLTRVVSERHEDGGVKIVVSGPLFAEAKAELKEKLTVSVRVVVFDMMSLGKKGRLGKKKPR